MIFLNIYLIRDALRPEFTYDLTYYLLFCYNSNCKGTDLDSEDCLYKEMALLTSSFFVGGSISNQYKIGFGSVPRFSNSSFYSSELLISLRF